ncbi:hypothetical protein GGE45_006421 [Rhizobium aethiopicum]|uniref:Uncharacterized protein n=1 Tax=Rhizobium aethiopicum TaxID=1138170 RepID=A0A7W6MKR3_9HYPH|nr:hypothetical protein [Rhizobium aethiopicum]MBB4584038.1 hypothetical protein [Rhizobium aethiopicum]
MPFLPRLYQMECLRTGGSTGYGKRTLLPLLPSGRRWPEGSDEGAARYSANDNQFIQGAYGLPLQSEVGKNAGAPTYVDAP